VLIGKRVLMTDWGEVECPSDLARALDRAPKRKDGNPDRRFSRSRNALVIERRAIREAEEKLRGL